MWIMPLSTGAWECRRRNSDTGRLSLGYRWTRELRTEVQGRLFGSQVLPDGRWRSTSPVYSIVDVALQKQWNALHLGLYVENILNWAQPDNPFPADADGNPQLDAAMIYGPIIGRRVRATIQWNLSL